MDDPIPMDVDEPMPEPRRCSVDEPPARSRQTDPPWGNAAASPRPPGRSPSAPPPGGSQGSAVDVEDEAEASPVVVEHEPDETVLLPMRKVELGTFDCGAC